MRTIFPLALLTLILPIAACGGAKPPADDEVAAARARAEKAAGRLMESLFVELSTAMKSGRPENAVSVCSEKAQALTAGIASAEGVSVRRTALRVRNPENAPDEFERGWMEDALQEPKLPGPEAVVKETGDGGYELRYVRPIQLAELCTKCHGTAEQIAPAVKDMLKERYPEDRATGFKTGELRGIVSVRVPFG